MSLKNLGLFDVNHRREKGISVKALTGESERRARQKIAFQIEGKGWDHVYGDTKKKRSNDPLGTKEIVVPETGIILAGPRLDPSGVRQPRRGFSSLIFR